MWDNKECLGLWFITAAPTPLTFGAGRTTKILLYVARDKIWPRNFSGKQYTDNEETVQKAAETNQKNLHCFTAADFGVMIPFACHLWNEFFARFHFYLFWKLKLALTKGIFSTLKNIRR